MVCIMSVSGLCFTMEKNMDWRLRAANWREPVSESVCPMRRKRKMQKIIICDDEITIRSGLTKLIGKHYPNLIIAGAASNGYEAMQLILDYRPDVVLMDINMPGLS